ncbi:Pentatricopeptide repeat-containing protein [Ananas comosus]|uniref:Pentatricopeptide repeat-containing protein n=1 Tax=Ananas comosus TaxID=4615 RepID=A0A199VJ39_ANACO|nr:Pentatricopeptide repeat-containing protein [Ananas comosus]
MLERGVAFKDVGFGCFIGKLCRSEVLGEVLGLVDKIKARTEGINGSIMAALIVDGLCRTGRIEEAWRALGELRMRGWKPDFIAYRIVSEGFSWGWRQRENEYKEFILSLVSESRIHEAKDIGEAIVLGDFPIEVDVLNALIGSVSAVDVDSASLFCNYMIEKEKFPSLKALSFAQCTLSNIIVSQSKTGKIVEGKPEYEVVVSNNCICSQSEVRVDCKGFSTVEDVDPNVFRQDGDDRCTVHNGLPVFEDDPIKFNYAWENPYPLKPATLALLPLPLPRPNPPPPPPPRPLPLSRRRRDRPAPPPPPPPRRRPLPLRRAPPRLRPGPRPLPRPPPLPLPPPPRPAPAHPLPPRPRARARRVPLLPASYHLAVAALLASDAPREALALFDLATSDAPAADLPGDLYNSLLAAASDSLAIARKVFDRMLERGVAFKDVGFGCFIGKLCRSEVLGEVLGLVDKIKARTEGINGSIMAALIVDGLCRTGRIEEAWRALGELRMRGWKPDFIAYRIVSEGFSWGWRQRENEYKEFILSLVSESRIHEAKDIGEAIVLGDFPIEVDVLNALIGSVSAVDVDSASLFCNYMIEKEKFPSLKALSFAQCTYQTS